MSNLFKYLLMAIVLAVACIWIMTVADSCNNPIDSAISTVDSATDKAGDLIGDGADAIKDGATALKDGAEDLISDDEDDEFDDAEFDEDGDEILDDEDADDEDMDDDEDEDDADLDERTITSSSSGSASSGKYLVVSGSFLGENNALKELSRLKKMGYNDAEIVVFDFSQYYTVCVKRTNSLSQANSLKSQLSNDHNLDAYVHKKRKGKRG